MQVRCPKCEQPIKLSDVNYSKNSALCKACGEKFCFSEAFARCAEAPCPRCGRLIGPDDINVHTDTALCKTCGDSFIFSDALAAQEAKDLVDNPPEGVWFEKTFDGFVAGASTRSRGAIWLVISLMLVTGFASLTVLASLKAKGTLNLGLTVAGVSFLAVAGVFWVSAVMMICGKVTVEVDGNRGKVFVGVGPLGWRKHFDWSGISGVRQQRAKWSGTGLYGFQIVLEGKKLIAFGSMLEGNRRLFVLGVLLRMLAGRKSM